MFGTNDVVEIAIGQINGFINPTKAERQAAYELFIELSSRATTVNDSDDERSIAIILNEIEAMSDLTRTILRNNGVDSAKDRKDGNVTLAIVALRVHNEILGPRVNKWMPLLNNARVQAATVEPETNTASLSWERTWSQFDVCRSELESMRDEVRNYMDTLARIAGSPGLSDLVVPVPPSAPITPIVPQDLDQPDLAATTNALPRYAMYRWFDPVGGALTLISHFRSGSHDRSFSKQQVARLRAVDGWFKRSKRRKLRRQYDENERNFVPLEPDMFRPIEIEHDDDQDLWFDYVSDMGDGIDPTLAVAWQLTRPSVTLPIDRSGESPTPPPELPRGRLLVMGGDQVYPYASARRYRDQLELPYELAARSQPKHGDDAPTEPTRQIVAIPGNHDWLGGIEAFEDVFVGSPGEPCTFAGWQAPQTERWWAIRLRAGWWMWGIDTGLDDTLDPVQVAYFEQAAGELQAGEQVIVCSPVPLWQLRQKRQEKYFDIRATLTALIQSKGADTPLFLAGDSHFFAHYRRVDGVADEHHITAGGGGAFLQPTHNLPQQIPLEKGAPDFKLGARWPRPLDSRALGANLGGLSDRQFRGVFAIVGGVHVAFAALVSVRLGSLGPEHPGTGSDLAGALDSLKWVLGAWTGWPLLVLMILAMIKATAPNSKESQLRTGAVRYGAMLGVAQVVAFVAVASFARWNGPLPDNRWLRLLLLPMIGGVLSTAIFVALVRWINRHIKANDTVAFSSAHLTRYKHFLRMCISPNGDLRVYCVGLDPVGKSWYYAVTGKPVVSTWMKAVQRAFGVSPAEAELKVRAAADRLAKRQRAWVRFLSRLAPRAFFFDTTLEVSRDRDRLIPPFDPAGVPKLHYVWGKEFLAASPQLLAERERMLGESHPQTIATRARLALQAIESGQVSLGLELARQNVESALRAYGPVHASTLAAEQTLADALAANGSHRAAAAHG